MGIAVIKVSPGDDYYVAWSSVSGSPECWGSRSEVLEYLIKQDHEKRRYVVPRWAKVFDRADEHGSSSYRFTFGQWGDATLQVAMAGDLPRAKLREFVESFDESKFDAPDRIYGFSITLLEPLED